MTRRLRILMVVDPRRTRIWHRRLAQDLHKRGHDIEIDSVRAGPSVPIAVSLLLTLERLVYGQSEHAPGATWIPDLATSRIADPDLVLDMSGSEDLAPGPRSLRPTYAGSLVEEGAIAELLSGGMPEIGISDSNDAFRQHVYRVAIERPRVLVKALDNLSARLSTIFIAAVEDIAAGRTLQGRAGGTIFGARGRNGAIAAVTGRARAALTSLLSKAPHWFVGWRAASDDRIAETMHLPARGWTRLPDDGARFYADPFLFQRGGRTWLFLEEYQYAVGKALISVVELGAQGPIGTPRPIIERPYHLSYPFVFERDGEIWMMPEMSAARRVELLRAVSFPDKWEPAATLLEGEDVSDATIVEHDNRLWMFGAVGEGSASSWDALHLWHASTLTGPWRPHARNPVLIDAASARPAGAMYRRGAQLWRPAQDCTRGYGSGLTLARVTQLDEDAFAQEVATTLYPGPAWPGIGLHTLNWTAGFEVVDGATAGRT